MRCVNYGGWHLHSDVEATRKAYRLIEAGGPERCGCPTCLNFIAARHLVYPSEVEILLHRLGIAAGMEAEVYEIGPLDNGMRLYEGRFHFVGRIQQEGPTIWDFDEQNDGNPRGPPDGISILFFHDQPAVLPEPFRGQSIVQLEFQARVPWVLAEPSN